MLLLLLLVFKLMFLTLLGEKVQTVGKVKVKVKKKKMRRRRKKNGTGFLIDPMIINKNKCIFCRQENRFMLFLKKHSQSCISTLLCACVLVR